VTKYISSAERDLHQKLDLWAVLEPMKKKILRALKENDEIKSKKLFQKLSIELGLLLAARELDSPETFDVDRFFAIIEREASKYRPAPKQELDLGSITFSINRPQIEGEEPKQITYED